MNRRSIVMICILFAISGVIMIFGNNNVKAAEVQAFPSTEMSTAPEIAVGTSYYAKLPEGEISYVSFVTPPETGYVTVTIKNITVDYWQNSILGGDYTACIKSTLGFSEGKIEAFSRDRSSSVELLSDINKAHEAKLESNTRYYIQFGQDDKRHCHEGNILFSVAFSKDENPNGYDQAEVINLNTQYTRTIDSNELTDTDYFKFTTTNGGAARISISCSAAYYGVSYNIRKCSTLEFARNSSGEDINGTFGTLDKSYKYVDAVFETNTSYYFAVWNKGVRSYTFSINNQTVSSIQMPAEITLSSGQSVMLW